jgi:protocatechuate 3,4-dioxygenase beta subunit
MKTETNEKLAKELSRRNAFTVIAGAGAAIAFGCGGTAGGTGGSSGEDAGATGNDAGPTATGGTDADAASGSDSGTTQAGEDSGTTGADGSACEVSPEGEIGPYFSDDSDARFNRSNILSNLDGTSTQSGVPLTLTVTVVDTEKGCAPYVNAQVDIWHCNSSGVYSDQASESTTTETWLRGYQLTDAKGTVTFVTIVPGWYSGRTTHIHLRLRSSYSSASSTTDGTNTTQLFFTQTFDDTLATSVTPYSAEGKNPTTNAGDHVFNGETNGANVLAVAGNATSGYVASITLGLPITAT